MKTDSAVVLKNISKTFPFPSPEEYLRMLFHLPNKKRKVKALSNISFNISHGQMLGVLGRNGSGKSTLLRVVAGLHSYDSGGCLAVNGQIAAIFEMGIHSNMFMTGREYCRRYFEFVGKPEYIIQSLEEEVHDFSELKNFFDEKINTYSSGMCARLFFGILMTQSDVGIYLLDEILSVGDALFQKKSYKRLIKLIANHNASGIFATHDWSTAMRICDNIMILDHGNIDFYGSAQSGVQKFLQNQHSIKIDGGEAFFGDKEELAGSSYSYIPGEDFLFEFKIEIVKDTSIAFSVVLDKPSRGVTYYAHISQKVDIAAGAYKVSLKICNCNIADSSIMGIRISSPILENGGFLDKTYDFVSWTLGNGVKLSPVHKNMKCDTSVFDISHRWRRLA